MTMPPQPGISHPPSVLDTDLESLNLGMYRVQHGAALNLEVDAERSSCLY